MFLPILENLNNEEEIMFLDVNAMYPYLAANNFFPIGSYEILSEEFQLKNIYFNKAKNVYFYKEEELFGIVEAKVFPPKKDNFPYLPIRLGDDDPILYSLCRICAQTKNRKECKHPNR